MSVSLRTGNRLRPVATPNLGFILGTAKAIPQYNPLGGSLRKSGAPDAYFIPVVLNWGNCAFMLPKPWKCLVTF